MLIVAITLVATFGFTVWAGRVLGVGRKLAELIAAGTSICGASAIVAANTVTDAHDEDFAYAIACVTIFGSVAMFAYPLLPGFPHLDSEAYGLWSGASIHEIAQVVAASFQNGQRAGEIGARVKLARVVIGFIALNSIISTPLEAMRAVVLTTFLLTLALAAMGLETDLAKLYAKGIRPAIQGALALLFIATFSLTLIKLAG